MELVKTREQLKKNIMTLDKYLNQGTDAEKKWARKRMLIGICFVACRLEEELVFAPSRFIGYVDNDIAKHEANNKKDGRITNPAISEIMDVLDEEPHNYDELLEKYFKYCDRFGIKRSATGSRGYTKKFWDKIL